MGNVAVIAPPKSSLEPDMISTMRVRVKSRVRWGACGIGESHRSRQYCCSQVRGGTSARRAGTSTCSQSTRSTRLAPRLCLLSTTNSATPLRVSPPCRRVLLWLWTTLGARPCNHTATHTLTRVQTSLYLPQSRRAPMATVACLSLGPLCARRIQYLLEPTQGSLLCVLRTSTPCSRAQASRRTSGVHPCAGECRVRI